MKLISMTEFVLQQEEKLNTLLSDHISALRIASSYDKVIRYAKFLIQPLTLEMFVPVDEEGNVLEKPEEYDSGLWHHARKWDVEDYRKAQEKVLFEGFKIIKNFNNFFFIVDKSGKWIRVIKNGTSLMVEDLLKISGAKLTPTALKQIGL